MVLSDTGHEADGVRQVVQNLDSGFSYMYFYACDRQDFQAGVRFALFIVAREWLNRCWIFCENVCF